MTAGEKKVLDALRRYQDENGQNHGQNPILSPDAVLRCPYCGKMNTVCEADISNKEGFVYYIERTCSHCAREWLEEWKFEARYTGM